MAVESFGLGSGLSLWSDSPGHSLQNPGSIILRELDTLFLGVPGSEFSEGTAPLLSLSGPGLGGAISSLVLN